MTVPVTPDTAKPWYKSATVLGALVFAIITEAQKQGVIPVGAVDSIASLIQAAAGVYSVFGLRRALG